MANTLLRVKGEHVDLIASEAATGATALTNWTEVDVEIVGNDYDDPSAGSPIDGFTPGRKRANITITGYVGGAENMSQLPQVDDELKSLSCETNNADAFELLSDIADESKYGKIIVRKTNYKQTDAPGTWTITARSGGR